jgi:uncharacterized membrane protein
MKIENVAIGLLILMFALILFIDAVLVTWNQSGLSLSSNYVRGIPGFVFVINAVFMLIKARDKAKK